jgi:hypothetical protein
MQSGRMRKGARARLPPVVSRAWHYLPNATRISIGIFNSLDDAQDDALEVEGFGDADEDGVV